MPRFLDLENLEITSDDVGKPGDLQGSLLLKKITTNSPIEIKPDLCRPWSFHNRDLAWLTCEKCLDLIHSIKKNGQHLPGLVRPLINDPKYKFEIIYGVRRWFACSQISCQKFCAYITDMDDKACTILMHSENADSKDISEFERASSFAHQLKAGIFKNQNELADAMNLTQGTISKMITASKIFDYDWLRVLFRNKLDIPIKSAYFLSPYLNREETVDILKTEAHNIIKEFVKPEDFPSASVIIKRLLDQVSLKSKLPITNTILAIENKPVVSCKKDKFGKIHIVIEQEATTLDRSKIRSACLKALDKFVFPKLFPGE